jgi:hypothetical protein
MTRLQQPEHTKKWTRQMSIDVMIELSGDESQLEKVQPLFSDQLPQTRSREGNEGVTVLHDLDAATIIILFEKWVILPLLQNPKFLVCYDAEVV